MRRPRRRNTYYTVFSLRDGTVTSALPMRKPAKRIMKRDHLRADPDNVIKEYASSGQELLAVELEQRVRFLDIIATSLNCRRALRQIVLPRLAAIEETLVAIRADISSLMDTSSKNCDRHSS